jgi:hypothetical protein
MIRAESVAQLFRSLWSGQRDLSRDRDRRIARDLLAEKQALETFTVSMEKEFLELGAQLKRIVELTREVRSRSSEIAEAASGHSEDAAIHFAFQLLKKAEDVVRASREQYAAVFAIFEKMQGDLAGISRERDSLMRTLAPLEATNTQFRIQACAFDEDTRSQFFALAEKTGAIVRDVRHAVGQRFEELDRSGRAIADLARKLAAMAAEQRQQTERMLSGTRAHLAALEDAVAASGRSAQSITAAGETIAGGVASAIMALQCQDMARQKFQHIGAAIDEMAAHLGAESDATDRRHFLADASCVQLGQLEAVFDQLDQAARQVDGGLAQVAADAEKLAAGALRSGSATLDQHVIAQAIESIRAVLDVIASAVNSIRGMVELVLKLRATFSDCTSQVLGLALRLRLVALNAQIFAARVEAGAALEVVAHNTRLIADESMHQLAGISSRVTELVDAVVELEQRLGDYSELASMEHGVLSREAVESESRLRVLEQHLRAAMSAIQPVELRLAESIQAAIGSIGFPAEVARNRSRSVAFFGRMAGDRSSADSAHHKLKDLKQNYTMAHEREIHESAVRASPADPQRAKENLADNVELF